VIRDARPDNPSADNDNLCSAHYARPQGDRAF
jgi:hypothetical protein